MAYLYYGIAWIIYFTIHSLLASTKVKKKLHLTLIPKKWYRFFYNTVSVVLLIVLILFYGQLEKLFVFPPHWMMAITGGVSLFFGAYLMLMSLRQYNLSEFSGTAYFDKKPFDDQLNTTGLNAHVRHPIYSATLLIIWGLWLLFPTYALLVAVIATSLYIPIGVYFEEKKLIKTFGKNYEDYKRKVPMIFPRKKS